MNLEVPVFIQIFHYFAREIVEETLCVLPAQCLSAHSGFASAGAADGLNGGSSSRWVVARNRTADTLARGGPPWCTKCAGRVALFEHGSVGERFTPLATCFRRRTTAANTWFDSTRKRQTNLEDQTWRAVQALEYTMESSRSTPTVMGNMSTF